MTVFVLTVMIFLVTLGLSISGLYFMVEAPAARKRMRARLGAIQQTSTETLNEEAVILREELLSQIPLVNRILLQLPLISRLQFFIQQAAMEMTAGMLILISMAIGLVVLLIGLLMEIPTVLLVPAIIGASIIPLLVVSFKRYRRFSRFEELFPDAIDLLARAVRAGHAFTTGLELIAREMPEPVAGEFRITYEQQNFGLPLREALRNLTVRVPLPDVNFFVTALQIQRESGGNLAEILDNLSYVIRERFKILRQVRVFTAQGRMTLYLLTALPPAAALLMYIVNPDYISRLYTDPLGHKAIAVAIVLQIIGYLIIRKIIRIKV